ncbi:AMIN-like domain-containing (lipo)protein [Streptomyces sparsogenes]|uniref:AMIN-like domain-containing (lipo)protein n=1 Tax=Streptomyces sparsogenes TaxID=67365 RepID=UPI0033DA9929
MRRWGIALAALTLAGAGLAATAGTAGAATTSRTAKAAAEACATRWGSGDRTAQATDHKPLANIRAGQHECYDRLVFDVKGGTTAEPTGYRVGYVDAMYQDGSGDPIAVGGGAILEIRVAATSYDTGTGAETYPGRAGKTLPGVDVTGYRTFRDTRYGASFEGETQIGLGVRARLPFRVFQSGDHLIVDVAHSWATAR